MIDKVRMTVDQETEEILERLKDDIEDRLSEKPFWAVDLLHETSSVAKSVKRVLGEISKTDEAIEENNELLKSLYALLIDQQSSLSNCHKKIDYMLMPWWKRYFRRKP